MTFLEKDKKDRKDIGYDLGNEPLYLPGKLYEWLPQCLSVSLLRRLDRDIFLTGALPVLAASMPNVVFRYSKDWLSLNVNTCVVANAGSGKGKLNLARKIGSPLNQFLHGRSKQIKEQWELAPGDEQPRSPQPPYKRLFLAGDSSAAALKEGLAANPHAVIFESEILTVTTVLRQEWGAFRDVILKSFHNETVSVERKSQEPIIIRRPALSMALSGTPTSFCQIISGMEDGLFSRFCFYVTEGEDEFISQFEDETDEQLDSQIELLGELILDIYQQLEQREVPLYIKFTRRQQELVTRAGHESTNHLLKASAPSALRSNVNRAVVMACKFADIFTVLRLAEAGKSLASATSIEVDEDSFRAGLILAISYLDHAIKIASLLADNLLISFRGKKRRFYSDLPYGEIETSLAYEIGELHGISDRDVRRYLRSLSDDKLLDDEGYGKWNKPRPAARVLFDLSVLSDLLMSDSAPITTPSGLPGVLSDDAQEVVTVI